jgi:hypothetical protein
MNAPAPAVTRCRFAHRAHRSSAQRDLEYAEEVQRHERDDHCDRDDELWIAELHAPSRFVTRGLDAMTMPASTRNEATMPSV